MGVKSEGGAVTKEVQRGGRPREGLVQALLEGG